MKPCSFLKANILKLSKESIRSLHRFHLEKTAMCLPRAGSLRPRRERDQRPGVLQGFWKALFQRGEPSWWRTSGHMLSHRIPGSAFLAQDKSGQSKRGQAHFLWAWGSERTRLFFCLPLQSFSLAYNSGDFGSNLECGRKMEIKFQNKFSQNIGGKNLFQQDFLGLHLGIWT